MALDRQAVLEATTMAIVTQGGPSYAGGCRYRGRDGRKCAVGHLISDEKYTSWIEGRPMNDKFIRRLVSESLGVDISDDDAGFLLSLQCAHDDDADGQFWERWSNSLERLSRRYNLRFPEELL